MIVKPIKTKLIQPKDDLIGIIKETVKVIDENSILAITSKVVSLCQNRLVPMSDIPHDELVAKEADKYLPRDLVPGNAMMHTIKNNILIGSAGIDRSIRKQSYILWPENPTETAKQICCDLKQHYKLKNFGIIITDSHSIPMRRGAVGISIAHAGFVPIKDYRLIPGTENKGFMITQSNVADSLATAAVVAMGEGNEQTPLALITDIPFTDFDENSKIKDLPQSSFEVPGDEDLFAPFLRGVPWKDGKR